MIVHLFMAKALPPRPCLRSAPALLLSAPRGCSFHLIQQNRPKASRLGRETSSNRMPRYAARGVMEALAQLCPFFAHACHRLLPFN
jgi:hypothetical protein